MAYITELRIFSFNFPPKGWMLCNGQALPISQYQALYSLMGTTFGGTATTFNLPNLMGVVPVHVGNGYVLGATGGEAEHQLVVNEMPAHTHQVTASSASPDVNDPTNANFASNTGVTPYGSNMNQLMNWQTFMIAGDDVPHDNMAPYLVLNICMCVAGIYPTRS